MLSHVISPPQIYRYYSTLSYIPIILCLVLLSLWYPALLIRSFTAQEDTLEKEVMKICGVVAWENPPQWTCMVLGALLGELWCSQDTCSPPGTGSCLCRHRSQLCLSCWI